MNKDLILNEFTRVSQAMGWDSYHSPKNLATAVSVEAAKLLENFQWLSDLDSEMLSGEQELTDISADIADLFIYLTILCHKLDLDPWQVTKDKLLLNRSKYIEQILSRQLVDQLQQARSSAPPEPRAQAPQAAQAAPEKPATAAPVSGNEALDWMAVAQKIAASRQELKEQSLRLKQQKSKDR